MSDWSAQNWENVDLSGFSEAFTIGDRTPILRDEPQQVERSTIQHVLIVKEKGKERIRRPVAANIALATAGAMGGVPGSPTPPIFSPLWMICTSVSGA